jgi:hypothetical protein
VKLFIDIESFSFVIFASESVKLQSIFDEIWQYKLSISPIQAPQHGIHNFDDKPADIPPKALINNYIKFLSFLERLTLIDKTSLTV